MTLPYGERVYAEGVEILRFLTVELPCEICYHATYIYEFWRSVS